MADFKAITTQEEFDEAIKARLERQEKTIAARYSDYDALKEAAAKHEDAVREWHKKAQDDAETIKKLKADLETANGKIKEYDARNLRASIAAEVGLPPALTDRLTGSTPEEIKKDAEALKAVFDQKNREGLPGFKSESGGGDEKTAALKTVLGGLNLNN